MTIDVRVNGYSLKQMIAGPPAIKDTVDAICRTLDLQIQDSPEVGALLGKEIELWYNNACWYHGYIQRRGVTVKGNVTLTAYDGLFFLGKNTDDFYFTNQTANQALATLCKKSDVAVASFVSTGAVFPALWYPGKVAAVVAEDLLARTLAANGRKFWLRWDPVKKGANLFERTKPKEAWSFLSGVNLTDASYEENVEEMYNVVKLVNRETGKVVTKTSADSVKAYHKRQHFEEVDKDAAKNMEKIAAQKLAEVSKVAVTMSVSGINPNKIMPQLFTGDVVYIEERVTKIVGAYYIKNITQTFTNDNLVEIAMDVQHAPEVPVIQVDDANKKPDFLKTKAEKEAESKKKKAQSKAKKVAEKAKKTDTTSTTKK
jgi:hypothetical protein